MVFVKCESESSSCEIHVMGNSVKLTYIQNNKKLINLKNTIMIIVLTEILTEQPLEIMILITSLKIILF